MTEKPDLNKPAFKMFPNAVSDVVAGKCVICRSVVRSMKKDADGVDGG